MRERRRRPAARVQHALCGGQWRREGGAKRLTTRDSQATKARVKIIECGSVETCQCVMYDDMGGRIVSDTSTCWLSVRGSLLRLLSVCEIKEKLIYLRRNVINRVYVQSPKKWLAPASVLLWLQTIFSAPVCTTFSGSLWSFLTTCLQQPMSQEALIKTGS